MKLLLYVFLISVSYSIGDTIADNGKKIVVKTFPKKVQPGLYQYKESGKYMKLNTSATKRPKSGNDYTVFPVVYEEKMSVPESPYFPIDTVLIQKPRVKKVLPDYAWHARSKRSVDLKKKDTDKDKKKASTHVKKSNKSPAKPGQKRNETKKTNKPKVKANKTKRLGKKAKRTGNKKNIKRKRKSGKRIGKRSRSARLRSGPNDPKLRYTKKAQKRSHSAMLRSRFGAKQARQLTKDRRNFRNMTQGTKNGAARRLIAARDASIEEYPYVVSIQKDKQHWCAGALLNPKLVITTANCMWKSKRMSRMHVRAGSRHTDRGGQVAWIAEVMKHPGWKLRKGPDNDIALLLLDRNIKFSHGVHGVDLPNRVMLPAFEDAWVTSWGTERRDGVYDVKGSTLQVYHTRLMDRKKCNNVTERFGVSVTENFICLSQTGKRAPCTRDTGSPAVSDGVLWGLASWGIRKLCGTERFPAMFSYIGSQTNLDFIINATHYLMADERFYPFPDRPPVLRDRTTTTTAVTIRF